MTLDEKRLDAIITEIGEHRPWLLERAMGTPNEGRVLAHEIAVAYEALDNAERVVDSA